MEALLETYDFVHKTMVATNDLASDTDGKYQASASDQGNNNLFQYCQRVDQL